MNNEYRIGFYGGDGTLQRVVSKPADPRPITDRDIRALFSYLDRAWLDAGVRRRGWRRTTRWSTSRSSSRPSPYFTSEIEAHCGYSRSDPPVNSRTKS